MAKNYATYPCNVMNITQGYTGSYTHSQHNTGSPKDFPWDEACSNSGRDWMFCPCDEMKVVRICGVGNGYTNTLWLESTTVVYFADGTSGYLILLITHPNDDDLKKIKKGDIFKRGEKICREGTDGNATGNHFHFSAGKGKMTGNGWKENSKGKWVLTCSVCTAKPEQIFYIDPAFTTIKNTKGLKFKEIPKATTSVTSSSTTTSAKKETATSTATAKKTAVDPAKSKLSSLAGTYKTTDNLNIRNGAGTNKKIMVTIPKGTKVKNYGYYTSVSGTKWLYVQFTYKDVTYTGFASSKYLTKI